MFLCFLIHTRSIVSTSISICILILNFSLFLHSDSQLLVCNPNIYSCSIPAIFHQELVHMPQLCSRSSSSEIPDRHLTALQSARGQKFLHFAKSGSFLDGMKDHDQTIYDSAVGLTLDCIAELFWLFGDGEVEEKGGKRKEREKGSQISPNIRLLCLNSTIADPTREISHNHPSQESVKICSPQPLLGTGPQLSPSFFHSLSSYFKTLLLSSPLYYAASSFSASLFPS